MDISLHHELVSELLFKCLQYSPYVILFLVQASPTYDVLPTPQDSGKLGPSAGGILSVRNDNGITES